MAKPIVDGPDIAIVGMVGRFPGAPDLRAYWRNLREGKTSIRRMDDAELDRLGVDVAERRDPHFVPVAASLDGIEEFDAAFFGYSPREAELMDPQQRIFLECAWEALEDAGIDPSAAGATGVFAGATTSTYLLLNLASRPELFAGGAGLQLFVGNTGDSLATRVAYKLGLRGPAFSVQSACSTSLLAVHLACQSLLNEECDLAIAGGVSVNLAQRGGYFFTEGSILSPEGVCAPFDASARGTIFGSGAGAVVLKRLQQAIDHGDCIRAVIRGTAVNNDGGTKAGFTAPSVDGQAAVIAEAIALSGISADDLGYIETHGTGTSLGDPIEIEALTRAFRASTQRKAFCPIGSVKASIGHLDVAAGVAGLIKTVLALENREVPPSPGFSQPNPRIDFAASPVFVNRALTTWPKGKGPRCAGVSSFGFGGTNVHAVLEEAPPVEADDSHQGSPEQLIILSAKSPEALASASTRLADHLEAQPALSLADAAFTLQTGRHAFKHRRMLVARDAAEAVARLRGDAGAIGEADEQAGAAFLFPGQGSLTSGMGAGLYQSLPQFRDQLDECAKLLRPHLGRDVRELIFKGGAELTETQFTQPATFALEYSLAKAWMKLGVEPKAMLGHSVGEYVAACLGGAFSLPDALALVAARGKLMQAMPRGAMLAVALPESSLQDLLAADHRLALGAVNERTQCVLAGPHEAIDAAAARLGERGVACKRLETSHAFHSPMMDPMLAAFRARVAAAKPQPTRLRFVSNVSGDWITPEQSASPDYWASHLRNPVRFADGLQTLRKLELTLLEVGPGQALSGMARRAGARAVASMPRALGSGSSEQETFLEGAGRLWLAGTTPKWSELHGPARRSKVSLPTYPFQRRRYWISPRPRGAAAAVSAVSEPPAEAQVLHPRPALDAAFVAPRSDLERELALLWQELLGIDRVGVEDNFFSIGGDSLLATQVASRLHARFGVEVPLQPLLETPTVAAMACLLVETLARSVGADPLADLLSEVQALSANELESALGITS